MQKGLIGLFFFLKQIIKSAIFTLRNLFKYTFIACLWSSSWSQSINKQRRFNLSLQSSFSPVGYHPCCFFLRALVLPPNCILCSLLSIIDFYAFFFFFIYFKVLRISVQVISEFTIASSDVIKQCSVSDSRKD